MNSPMLGLRVPVALMNRLKAEASRNDEAPSRVILTILEEHFGIPHVPPQKGGWPKGKPRNGVNKRKHRVNRS